MFTRSPTVHSTFTANESHPESIVIDNINTNRYLSTAIKSN
jgi:hypothetical protein